MEGLLISCVVGIAVAVVLVIIVMVQLGGVSRRLRIMEGRFAASRPAESPPPELPKPSLEDRKQGAEDQKKLFKLFIQQFPGVPDLPKKEQFERFRAWRRERGL